MPDAIPEYGTRSQPVNVPQIDRNDWSKLPYANGPGTHVPRKMAQVVRSKSVWATRIVRLDRPKRCSSEPITSLPWSRTDG